MDDADFALLGFVTVFVVLAVMALRCSVAYRGLIRHLRALWKEAGDEPDRRSAVA